MLGTQKWGAETLKALRAVPAETILASMPEAVAQVQPVIDGQLIPDEPARLFAAGKQAPVPFLLGSNSFEASLMTILRISPANLVASSHLDPTRLSEIYGPNLVKQGQGIFMDGGFLAPDRFLASQMQKVHQPAYLYYFSYVAVRRRGQSEGVPHGSEIPFVFDNLNGPLAAFTTAADREMAATVSGYWVQFAKTGDPNRKGAPEWPAYTPATDGWLDLGAPIELKPHFRQNVLSPLETVFRLRMGVAAQ